MFAFVAGAWAENTGLFADSTATHRDQVVQAISADDQTPSDFTTRESNNDRVPAAQVDDPERVLTNLTVYAQGRDVGHIRNVALDPSGHVARLEIAFNDGSSSAWVDAKAMSYDPAHRRVVSARDPGEIKALEHARFR
jgi:hypothetical protein